jgi:dTDP-4-amino-4,6-dideoxygalactose transaminase
VTTTTITKRSLSDLAMFGGSPLFDEPLHVGRPNVGDRGRLFERLDRMLDRRVLTNDGPLVREFEARLAELIGVRHVIAVCNATIGLEIVARALDLRGEVIVPSFTFIATAHALSWLGITPVFADVDEATLTLDPVAVERLIGPQTSAILGVHVWGRVCNTAGLQAVADAYKLKVAYDAAHALGCRSELGAVGTFGHAEVFSFHATKFVNSFEGGAISTDDDETAEKLRLMRNFGFVGFDRTARVGTNGKMTEVCAAMGLTSLESMADFVATNLSNASQYSANLTGIEGIRLLEHDRDDWTNHQYIVIRVDRDTAPISRDLLQEVLIAENVLARRYFYPGAHRMAPYSDMPTRYEQQLPVTERACDEVLSLPTGTAVDEDEIGQICDLIRFAAENADAIRDRLSRRVAVR